MGELRDALCKLLWGGHRDAIGEHIEARLEMQLESVIERVWRIHLEVFDHDAANR